MDYKSLQRQTSRELRRKDEMMVGDVVETLYGKRHKYEIRATRSWLKTQFAVYRNGARWKGDYASLARAVAVVKEAE